jgi:putative ABC transport system permease protein
MQTLFSDLRYGLRVLLRAPGSTAIAVVALALGIGANTAIFSLVDAVLLRPLPYQDPDRLVQVWEDASHVGFPRNTPAPGNYADWRQQNQVFEDMAASRSATFTLTGRGDPEAVVGRLVTANLFAVLGARPALGRVFTADEDRPGGPPVAVIGDALWRRRFGGDRGVVGSTVEVDGRTTTIVGVMPRDFVYPQREHEMWLPIAFTPEELANRRAHYLQVVARLRPDVPLERARADLSAIAQRLQRDFPSSNKDVGAVVIPLADQVLGNTRDAVLVLMIAVGCVLLIACANVANLLLSRATARRREIAVRVALGAGRWRIVRQLLTESVLLALLGGVLGLTIALWSFDLLATFIPEGASRAAALGLDARVLGFTALLAVATGIVFGLAPALSVSRQDLGDELRAAGAHGFAGSHRRLRGALVVSEVALAFLLLAGAGLMLKAFARVRALDPGFRAENVLTARTLLPSPRYDDDARRHAFYDAVHERVGNLPGVIAAGYTGFLPLTNRAGTQGFTVEGRPRLPQGEFNDANFRVVSPGYQASLGMPMREGRFIAAGDRLPGPRVVVVNQAFVRKYLPDGAAVGRRIKLGGFDSDEPWMTVVGVVGDVRQMGLEHEARSEMYVPYAQDLGHGFFSPKDLAIRVDGDPMALAESVRKAIWEVDPLQPVSDVRPLQALLDGEVAARSVQSSLLAGFAALALVLASLGIYGVLSYTVAQRRREIGIRMALGAPAGEVVRMVVRQGLVLWAIGILIGLAAALAVTRALASLLYGVSATDPATFAAGAAVLGLVAAFASWLPARQAARVDPMITLKAE